MALCCVLSMLVVLHLMVSGLAFEWPCGCAGVWDLAVAGGEIIGEVSDFPWLVSEDPLLEVCVHMPYLKCIF